jgi:hypothetical protein
VEPAETGSAALGLRPVRTLAAFADATAGPGQTAEVRLTVPARAFARYDETARTWIWPPGEFSVRIGRSVADLRLSVQVKSLFLRTDRPYPPPGTPRASRGCRSISGMRARATAARATVGVIIGCAACSSRTVPWGRSSGWARHRSA